MPKRHNFYDPQLGPSEPLQIRGVQVTIGGTYVLMDDVLTALRVYAQSLDPDDAAAVHGAAGWLQAGAQAPPQIEQVPEEVLYQVHGAEPDDVTHGVDRIEIYPDPPDDPNAKWYARSVNTQGFILKVTDGSFDQAWVIRNAEERFPGIPLYLLKSAGEDSKWVEDQSRGVFPSKGPPIRRLFEGASR